jgi:predicted lysophospholipase L1 biosynthesis ABC-type transport system permease subunit
MARKRLTPAEVVIAEFGIRPLARELNIDPTTIVRWRGSARGLVPSTYHTALLALADRERVPLTAEDLVNGRAA